MKRILLGPVIAAALACAAQAAAAPSPCRAGEAVVFSCRLGAKAVSACAAGAQTVYRYGPAGAPEMEIASNGHDGRAFQSAVRGQGGGSGANLRFVNAGYSYILSTSVQGSLADHPGKRASALTVMKGDAVVSSRDCVLTSDPSAMDSSTLPDDPDENFVGWY